MDKYIATNDTVFEYSADRSKLFINGEEVNGADLIEFVGKQYILNEISRLEKLDPGAYLNWKATRTT